MGKYSIKDLETLSGIKAHTIRIWEKRYGVITPDRTDTNIRTYCDTDLKKLLNIALLNNNGLKISKISKLGDEDLYREVEKFGETDTAYSTYIDRLVVAMVDFDRPNFERILKESTLKHGFEGTCIHVLYPLLNKIGIMWMANSINPAQEHFVTSLIIQKMYVATDGLYKPNGEGKKAIFFLREGEMHEIGLLFFRYLMKKRGFDCLYLGQTVPMSDLVQTVKAFEPHYLVTAFVAKPDSDSIEYYLKDLSSSFPKLKIIASGNQLSCIEKQLPKNVIRTEKVDDLIAYLDSLSDQSK